ncbi:hypothetical protein ACPW7J_14625 (plasmid) [Ihubacter sp. rT4E-8]|uniref:hypothetical protein n=1 Tax=Ihubacter sp. rT4E-8 TaxID=3242369 RepID=UPI003CF96DDC
MSDKMSMEQNIFYVKRNMIDLVWKESMLEGINVMYPDTQAICEGINVPTVSVRDIVVINNLKYCWQFTLDIIKDYPVSLIYINQINRAVGGSGEVWNAGVLRISPVNIGGTTWIPEIPAPETVVADIDEIMQIASATHRAMTMMLYLMRSQLYNDSNKRTAQLVANKIMIENGCGIISIPKDCIREFNGLLIAFYETNDSQDIMDYVYNHCISGMTQ